jgi:hypothetical protein
MLRRTVGTARLPTDQPRWWRVIGLLQWLLAVGMAVGLSWLRVITSSPGSSLPDLPTLEIGELPLPTVLPSAGRCSDCSSPPGSLGKRGRGPPWCFDCLPPARRRSHGRGSRPGHRPIDAELATMRRLHELI